MRIRGFELPRNERSRKSPGFPTRRAPGTRSTPRGSHHAVPRLCRSGGSAHNASGVSADPPGPCGSTGWVERNVIGRHGPRRLRARARTPPNDGKRAVLTRCRTPECVGSASQRARLQRGPSSAQCGARSRQSAARDGVPATGYGAHRIGASVPLRASSAAGLPCWRGRRLDQAPPPLFCDRPWWTVKGHKGQHAPDTYRARVERSGWPYDICAYGASSLRGMSDHGRAPVSESAARL